MKKEVRGIYEEEVSERLNNIETLLKKLGKRFDTENVKNVIGELHALEGVFLQAGFLKNSSVCLITKDIMYKVLEDEQIDPETVSIIRLSLERLRASLKLIKVG